MLPSVTTSALLEDLADPSNEEVWQAFDARFRPIISGFAVRLGLGAADAADAAQETLIQFIRDYRAGKFDRQRGRLSAWIIGIARHRVMDVKRRRAARREWRGESAFVELPDDDALTQLWDAECKRAMLCQAIAELARTSRIVPQTLEAFRMLVVDGKSAAEVADALNIPPRMVYMAKHRCLGKLKEILATLQASYEIKLDPLTE